MTALLDAKSMFQKQLETVFRQELALLLRRHSKERGSDAPDFILAQFLSGCLGAFDGVLTRCTDWFGEGIGQSPGANKAGEEPDLTASVCNLDNLPHLQVDRNQQVNLSAGTLLLLGGRLLSEHGENPQYDRAIAELVSDVLGLSMDHVKNIITLMRMEKNNGNGK